MISRYFIFIIVVLFFACNSSQKIAAPGMRKKGEWESLFDGKTTSGWHKFGGGPAGASWKVIDGVLQLDPSVKSGGDIVTDKEFENFDLKLEWKISEKGNSGIIFFVNEDKQYKYPWETGPEMQVLDNIGAEDNKKENHLAGTLYDLLGKAEDSKPKPIGEWNQAEIKCLNGKLDLYLNGINIVSTALWDDNWAKMIAGSKFKSMKGFGIYKKGHICLQDHGNMVWYRNIRIREF